MSERKHWLGALPMWGLWVWVSTFLYKEGQ